MTRSRTGGSPTISEARLGRRWKWLAVSVAIATTLGGFAVFTVSILDGGSIGSDYGDILEFAIFPSTFAWLGVVIVCRHSANRIGWLPVAIGFGFASSSAVDFLANRLDPTVSSLDVTQWLNSRVTA